MGGSSAEAQSEFSRTVGPERLGDQKIVEQIEATEAERERVRGRLDLLGLDWLSAKCRIAQGLGGMVTVECDWEADLAQACVVTLEPVMQALSGRFQALYRANEGEATVENDVTVDPEADDPPEPLPPAGIDLGELVVQELAVALDPYPRLEGAELPRQYQSLEEEGDAHPFAALKVLKSKE